MPLNLIRQAHSLYNLAWGKKIITIITQSCLLPNNSAFISSWFQLGAWALVCRNLCQRVGVRGYNGSLYNKGMNYCSRCTLYFHNEGATHCFCCGSKLRYKSRGAKRRKDQEQILQHEPMRGIWQGKEAVKIFSPPFIALHRIKYIAWERGILRSRTFSPPSSIS